jgi:hypothetical protein
MRLMLFNSNSDLEASRSQVELSSVISSICESNRELSQRLASIEAYCDPSSIRRQSNDRSQLRLQDNPNTEPTVGDSSQQAGDRTLEATLQTSIGQF